MTAEPQPGFACRLTGAQKQMRYKQKMRRDPQKYEEYKTKQREAYHAKKRLVKDLTQEERDQAREIWKIRKQKLRKNSKPAFAIQDLTSYTMLSAQKRKEELNAAPGPSAGPQEQEDSDSETSYTELPVRVVSEPARVSDPLAGAHTHHRCALCANTTNYYTDAIDRPYFHNNHTKLALNDLNIDVHLANSSKVCLDCDSKLLGILDFMKQVKDAQQLNVNRVMTDTVIVKKERESPTFEYEIDVKEEIEDSVKDPTELMKLEKRKCDDDKPKPSKRQKIPKDKMPVVKKLITNIKVEPVEIEVNAGNMHEASEDTRREDTAPDIGAKELVIASNALSNKTMGDGVS